MSVGSKTKTLLSLTVCTIGLILGVRGCVKPQCTDVLSVPVRAVSRLVVKQTALAKQSPPGDAVVTGLQRPYVPPEAKVVLTPKDPTKKLSDVVDVHVQTYGLCLKPGVELSLPYAVGFDTKLAFYKRYGLGPVVNYRVRAHTLYVGGFVSRHLDSVDNLETVVGVQTDFIVVMPYLGLRLSL